MANIFKIPGHKRVSGEVGIEVELEGGRPSQVGTSWMVVQDGSLSDGYECVLKAPVGREFVNEALEGLYGVLSSEGVIAKSSVRTSVHVHINVQEMSLVELATFLTLYLIFEELLVDSCGDGRQGNLFCLRTCDAEFSLSRLIGAISRNRLEELNTDELRYSAVNLKALADYGSLEFRSLRSPVSGGAKEVVSNWVGTLLAIKDGSKLFKDPVEVVGELSKDGYSNFLEKIFGNYSDPLKSNKLFHKKVSSGEGNARDLAFCTDWGKFNVEEIINPWEASCLG